MAFGLGSGCFAVNSSPDIDREYLDDGSYIETVLFIGQGDVSLFASNVKTASKVITYKNKSGEVQWTATLRATFVYNGSNASCNTAYMTTSISNDSWKIPTATATKNGNKATGNVVAKRYNFGVLAKTVERTATLTCSASGVIS